VSAEAKREIELEIAHVLFLDIVGYSKLSINEQHARIQELNEIVRESEQFRKAEAASRILKIPTGDGMALVFYKSPEEPAQCASEISRALKSNPRLQIRMGIHSGPVSAVVDVTERTNVAGAGINMAQRVMDCGDAGHILLSHRVAEDLEHYERWRPLLHDLGTFEVKHGMRVSVTNLYSDEVGNSKLPVKLQAVRKHQARLRWAKVAIALLVLAAMVAALLYVFRRAPARSLANVVEKSIAVLPFENLSSDKENAYFADGVQDEILTDLAKIADLKVISRTSVMQYKSGVTRNLREIGQQLGVAHLMEGSVQRANGKVRVNAQLIDVRNDAHLWAQSYDRDLADVFALQSEIAKTIADQLQARLSPSEKKEIEQAPTTDLAAFELYSRAKTILLTSGQSATSEQDLEEAIELLGQAVKRDVSFFDAYCQLAFAHGTAYAVKASDHTLARLAKAEAAVQAATRLRPNAAEAHLARAQYLYFGLRDYAGAMAELETARPALPNDPRIFEWTGYILRRRGQREEGLRNLERAVALDPRNVFTLQQLGISYVQLGRYAGAVAAFDRAVLIVPDNIETQAARAQLVLFWKADTRPLHQTIDSILGKGPGAISSAADVWFFCALAERDAAAAARALVALGDNACWVDDGIRLSRSFGEGLLARMMNDETKARTAFEAARAQQEKIVQAQPDYGPPLCVLAMIDAALGRKELALEEGRRAIALTPMEKDISNGSRVLQYFAITAASAGEKELALQQLETGLRALDASVALSYGALKLHPIWDPLRGDPRFEKIVASLAPKE
jgi:TolB-like protein/class 3 adenylate cyclase/Tfp pilus assembly protein PilF